MSGVQFSSRHEENSVLIVNDVPEQLTLMDTLLRRAGYLVLKAEDGLEAFNLAKENLPDLVISDVRMPRVGGLELCRLMRADTQLRSVPILLVSAVQHDTASVVEGLRAGADDYLDVPFDSTRLVAKVARLLERSRLEANYRNLVEQASDVIFTQDLSGRLTSINTAGASFVGRDPHGLLGDSFFSVFGLPGVDHKSNGFADGFDHSKGGQEFRHQFIAKRISGEERWLDLTMSPIRDRTGETVGFRGLARDVTDRKQVELALRDSEERYRLLFESTPQPMWVLDQQTFEFLTVNEAATRTYGYTKDEFLSMTLDDIGAREGLPAPVKDTLNGDEPVISGPWRHQTKDKKNIYVQATSHPVLFDGKKSRLVIVNDITERKLLDEKQERLRVSLQQSAMEWRQTFSAIDFPVLIVDLEGRIRRANEAAEQSVGAEEGQLVGRSVADLDEGQPWKTAAEWLKGIREIGISGFARGDRRDDRQNMVSGTLSG